MKFSCNRAELNDALSLMCDIVPPRAAKPVLQNICITGCEDGFIELSATDLEIGLQYKLAVEDLVDPQQVLLPATRLHGLIRDDWSESITLSIEDDRAEIQSVNGTFQLLGQSSEDFPSIPEFPESGYVEISAEDIIDGVSKTMFATAKGDARYALNGIFMNIAGSTIELVASDTHRLSLSKKKIRNESDLKQDAIIVPKGMSELAKLCKDEESIKIVLTNHEMMAKTSCATLVARLVDGQFPRYRDVIPKEMVIKISIPREQFMKSLRLGGQMTNEETRSVLFKAEGSTLRLSSSGSEVGSGTIDIPASIEGGSVQAAFNYIYVLDMLRVLSTDEIVIQFKDSESPARIDVNDFTHIIMPIRPRG